MQRKALELARAGGTLDPAPLEAKLISSLLEKGDILGAGRVVRRSVSRLLGEYVKCNILNPVKNSNFSVN